MFKSVTSKRIIAYLIDIFIVALITSMFASLEFLNPNMKKINEIQNEYAETLTNKAQQTVTPSDILDTDELINLSYDISYYGVYQSAIAVVVAFIYFVVFQYFNKGQTIGKALLDIIVVTKDNKKVSFMNIFLRSIIINNILSDTMLIIAIRLMAKKSFLTFNSIISIITTGILVVSIILLLFRNDNRLVHDLFAGTKVIKKKDLESKVKVAVKEN